MGGVAQSRRAILDGPEGGVTPYRGAAAAAFSQAAVQWPRPDDRTGHKVRRVGIWSERAMRW
jgi:hypothetical protein